MKSCAHIRWLQIPVPGDRTSCGFRSAVRPRPLAPATVVFVRAGGDRVVVVQRRRRALATSEQQRGHVVLLLVVSVIVVTATSATVTAVHRRGSRG